MNYTQKIELVKKNLQFRKEYCHDQLALFGNSNNNKVKFFHSSLLMNYLPFSCQTLLNVLVQLLSNVLHWYVNIFSWANKANLIVGLRRYEAVFLPQCGCFIKVEIKSARFQQLLSQLCEGTQSPKHCRLHLFCFSNFFPTRSLQSVSGCDPKTALLFSELPSASKTTRLILGISVYILSV